MQELIQLFKNYIKTINANKIKNFFANLVDSIKSAFVGNVNYNYSYNFS